MLDKLNELLEITAKGTIIAFVGTMIGIFLGFIRIGLLKVSFIQFRSCLLKFLI